MTNFEYILDWTHESKCGRPTKKGQGCGNLRARFAAACSIHSSPDDKALEKVLWDLAIGKTVYDESRKPVVIPPPPAPKPEKRMTYNGGQVVRCGKTTWVWHGDDPLAVGDLVWVERPWFLPSDYGPVIKETVTKLGSRYAGDLKAISSKA